MNVLQKYKKYRIPMMLSVRKATTADCSLIRSLASGIWEPTYGHILKKDQLDFMFEQMYGPDNIRKQMEEQGHVYFLLYSGDAPCGYISIEQPEEDLFIFQKIYLLPSMQGKGAGRYLVERGFDYIREVHPAACKVMLYVNRANRALEFYKRLGFRIAGTRDYPIGHDYYMNDYIMDREV